MAAYELLDLISGGNVELVATGNLELIAELPAITGDLAFTEEPDVVAIAGDVIISGDLAFTEELDVVAIAGGGTVTGTLAYTEPRDIVAISVSSWSIPDITLGAINGHAVNVFIAINGAAFPWPDYDPDGDALGEVFYIEPRPDGFIIQPPVEYTRFTINR